MKYLYTIKNYKKEIITVAIMLILPLLINYATEKNIIKNRKMESFMTELEHHMPGTLTDEDFITVKYPIFSKVVLVGDSYSYFLGYDIGQDVVDYCRPGYTLYQLEPAMVAASKTDKEYAVIFIGPNDFRCMTELDSFKKELQYYVDLFKKNGKKVILNTYLHSEFSDFLEKTYDVYYPIDDYNKKILEIVEENDDVYYNDISVLDDYKKYRRPEKDDTIHYNKEFNLKLAELLYKLLLDIAKSEIER